MTDSRTSNNGSTNPEPTSDPRAETNRATSSSFPPRTTPPTNTTLAAYLTISNPKARSKSNSSNLSPTHPGASIASPRLKTIS
jgi:hypothetical protein